jgi:hypothetical protein
LHYRHFLRLVFCILALSSCIGQTELLFFLCLNWNIWFSGRSNSAFHHREWLVTRINIFHCLIYNFRMRCQWVGFQGIDGWWIRWRASNCNKSRWRFGFHFLYTFLHCASQTEVKYAKRGLWIGFGWRFSFRNGVDKENQAKHLLWGEHQQGPAQQCPRDGEAATELSQATSIGSLSKELRNVLAYWRTQAKLQPYPIESDIESMKGDSGLSLDVVMGRTQTWMRNAFERTTDHCRSGAVWEEASEPSSVFLLVPCKRSRGAGKFPHAKPTEGNWGPTQAGSRQTEERRGWVSTRSWGGVNPPCGVGIGLFGGRFRFQNGVDKENQARASLLARGISAGSGSG